MVCGHNLPAIDAMPYMAPISPVYAGRLCRGTEYAMTIKAPENIPAQPMPAIARPTIRALDVGAIPQTSDPSSKIPMALRKTVLMEKME